MLIADVTLNPCLWYNIAMTKTKWQLWIESTTPEFQKEILLGKDPTRQFFDFGDNGVTLEELEILDNKYNL